ncbi:MAG: hypothetical protein CMJ39_01935 [Phycisphaerae bacterium]|nr:hypothetical protein [Phycisphaerae bacterium]
MSESERGCCSISARGLAGGGVAGATASGRAAARVGTFEVFDELQQLSRRQIRMVERCFTGGR